MIMPKIAIEWTAQSNIRNEAIRLARPLLEAAALQAVKTRDRVQKTGIGGSGRSFRPYSKSSKKTRARLGLQTGHKDFTRTGTFWRSMKAKLQSPTKASVVFTGRAAKGKKKTEKGKVVRVTNAALSRIVLDKESESLFSMGQKEVNAISEYLAGRLTMEILVEQFVEESGFQLARKTRSMERKAKKAVHSLRGR